MKKLTTKLLMSIIAVAFAFVALGTSTYAWFAMNQSVSVTGMQISAKSDSTYLIIGESDNLTALQDANNITVAMTVNDDVKVYPSAHETTVTNAATAEVVGNWYYETAEDPDDPTAKANSKVALTSASFAKYVIKKTVYVTLAKGSNQASDLKVSSFGLTQRTDENLTGEAQTITPVKVLVASPTTVVELDSTKTGENIPSTVLASTVTDAATIKLDIYIYYYGNDAAVYTNNIANLAGATIALSFGVTTVAQGA